ncbi:hypothetical protein Peur_010124 [Populus x canadensis]
MNMLQAMRKQLQRELIRKGFIPEDVSSCNTNAHVPEIVVTPAEDGSEEDDGNDYDSADGAESDEDGMETDGRLGTQHGILIEGLHCKAALQLGPVLAWKCSQRACILFLGILLVLQKGRGSDMSCGAEGFVPAMF